MSSMSLAICATMPAPTELAGEGNPLATPGTEFFAVLRDPSGPEPARREAWRELCRWIHDQHGWAVGRLHQRLVALGLESRLGAGDVINAWCLKVWLDPRVLGDGERPSRSWLWWRLQDVLRSLAAEAREPPRALPSADPEAPGPVADATYREGATPQAFEDPARLAVWRELNAEMDRQLERLRRENQEQHLAIVLKAELSYEDVARQMGKSEGTVKSLVKRGRDLLRARMARLSWPIR